MKKLIIFLSLILCTQAAIAGPNSTILDKIENSILDLHIQMNLKPQD